MGQAAEALGDRLVTNVVTEAFDEMIGRSNRKWAVMLTAAIAGAIIAAVITRRRIQPGKVAIASGPDTS